jgi:hypothetical protein
MSFHRRSNMHKNHSRELGVHGHTLRRTGNAK